MLDRRWLGDLSLAVLLALPLVALTRPQAAAEHRATAIPVAAKVTVATRVPGDGRIGLLG